MSFKKQKVALIFLLCLFTSIPIQKVIASAPVISNGSPTGTLATDTLQITISVTTDVNATCKYAYNSSTAYNDPNYSYLFTTTGGTSHSKTLNYLANTTNGQIYDFYVRCDDGSGNINTDPYHFTFSVNTNSVPTLRNGSPSGILPIGTTQATLSFFTDQFVSCKCSTSPNTLYDSMSLDINDYGTYHSVPITGLVAGSSYTYYVRCIYPIGNPNTTDFPISFSVPAPITFSISNMTKLVANWIKSESGNISDITGDFIVNSKDFGVMMSKWQ